MESWKRVSLKNKILQRLLTTQFQMNNRRFVSFFAESQKFLPRFMLSYTLDLMKNVPLKTEDWDYININEPRQ